jgi:hypothetical protein
MTSHIDVDFSIPTWNNQVKELNDLNGETGLLKIGDGWTVLLNGSIIHSAKKNQDGQWEEISLDKNQISTSKLEIHKPSNPSLAVLFSYKMCSLSLDDDYYTNDLSLKSIDERVRDESETVFIKMHKNTMLGTHYICYINGERYCITVEKSSSSERKYFGQDSYSKAKQEVCVYQVYDAQINVDYIEHFIPDTEETSHSTTNNKSKNNKSKHTGARDSVDDNNGNERNHGIIENSGSTDETNDTTDITRAQDDDDSESSEPVKTIDKKSIVDDTQKESGFIVSRDRENKTEFLRQEIEDLKESVSELQAQVNDIREKKNKQVQSIEPQEALHKTDLNIRYQLPYQDTLSSAKTDDMKDITDSISIVPRYQSEQQNLKIGNQTFHSFISTTNQYLFLDWLIRDFYQAISKNQNLNLGGVLRILEDLESVSLVENFGNTRYSSVFYDRGGVVRGVSKSYDDTVSIEQIKTAISDVSSSTENFDKEFVLFIILEGQYQNDIYSAMDNYIDSGGLIKKEKRDSVVNKNDVDVQICLIEKYKNDFFLVYPSA